MHIESSISMPRSSFNRFFPSRSAPCHPTGVSASFGVAVSRPGVSNTRLGVSRTHLGAFNTRPGVANTRPSPLSSNLQLPMPRSSCSFFFRHEVRPVKNLAFELS